MSAVCFNLDQAKVLLSGNGLDDGIRSFAILYALNTVLHVLLYFLAPDNPKDLCFQTRFQSSVSQEVKVTKRNWLD